MKKYLIGLFIVLLAIFACTTKPVLKADEVSLKIASKKVDCTGLFPMKCMQVKENESNDWLYFYDEIKGFTYEEGYEYELIVQKKDKEKPVPADVSSVDYILIKEVKKTKK